MRLVVRDEAMQTVRHDSVRETMRQTVALPVWHTKARGSDGSGEKDKQSK